MGNGVGTLNSYFLSQFSSCLLQEGMFNLSYVHMGHNQGADVYHPV